ncbi:PQQ-binding-like beta-propeller repeat protein [Halomarina halobia]|uniref:PQQ-binding-like beta-propeller repeat protein n=1 Tax=Halomarina halobia TaxID=3033386 RepID=A0ABD6A7K7_9EURY|nr:PQQ-binding-like beta-propeller repeat protein [Halomarina sp. PSR21]
MHRVTRRSVLEAGAAAGVSALAGCQRGPSIAVERVEVNPRRLYAGESVRVEAVVVNDGEEDGTATVAFAVDGAVVSSTTVRVPAGERVTASVSRTFEAAGTYALSVDGVDAGTIRVEPAIVVRDARSDARTCPAGSAVALAVTVENRATVRRTATLTATVDGRDRRSVAVDLAGGERRTETLRQDLGRPGERTVAVAGVPVATVTVTDAWRQFGYDAANTGRDDRTMGPTEAVEQAWTYTGRASRASPVVADGTVYVGFGNVYVESDRGGMVALDAATGAPRWRVETDGRVVEAAAVADGAVVFGTVAGNIRDGDTSGEVVAVEADTGEERWRVDAGGAVFGSPAVDAGVAYVGTAGGGLLALDVRDGSEVWRREADDPVIASVAVDGSAVYVGGRGARLRALSREDGSERWAFETAGPVFGAPSVADGVVYATGSSQDPETYAVSGALVALDAETGERRWRAATNEWTGTGASVGEETLIAGVGLSVRGYDRETGVERWTVEASEYGTAVASRPAVVDGTAYVGTSGVNGGSIYALSVADGSVRWTHPGDSALSSPAVLDGAVYVGTGFSSLRALRER